MIKNSILILTALLLTNCQMSYKYDQEKKCANYDPVCGVLGNTTKECTYNKEGCRTCSCVPASAQGTNYDSNRP